MAGFTTAAILGITAAASAAGQVASAKIGSNASKDAAKGLATAAQDTIPVTQQAVTQAQEGIDVATTDANKLITDAAAKQLEAFKPYIDAGQITLADALKAISSPEMTGQFKFGKEDLDNEEGYQFALAEGEKALNRSSAAKGRLFSGAATKDLMRFGQGNANQYFNDALNRKLSIFKTNRDGATSRINNLLDIAQMGMTGVSQGEGGEVDAANRVALNKVNASTYKGDVGLRGAQLINDATTGAASANAAGRVGSASAWQGAIGGITGFGQQIADYLAQRDIMNKMRLTVPPRVAPAMPVPVGG